MTKAKKPKRAPADQPPPEAARLLLRGPLDFHIFERGAAGKVYSPGQGWSSCKVVAANDTGVLILSGGSLFVVADARNVLTAEEHHSYQLHRARFARDNAPRHELLHRICEPDARASLRVARQGLTQVRIGRCLPFVGGSWPALRK